jgi:Putative abortive phage resistance protein AbiGi, antitoxin
VNPILYGTELSRQRYVSKELTHFVGRSLPSDEERYALLVKILREGWLTHPPHQPGISGNLRINAGARISSNEMYSPEVVCFCDIPLEDLEIHVEKYGSFGFAFPKAFLVGHGANPVFYVANPSRIHNPFLADLMRDPENLRHDKILDYLEQRVERGPTFDRGLVAWHRMFDLFDKCIMETRSTPGVPQESHELQDLQRFLNFHVFSFIKCFDPNLDDSHHENFYMEREWRVVGNVPFKLADLSRVLLHERFGSRLRADVPGYAGQIHFLG